MRKNAFTLFLIIVSVVSINCSAQFKDSTAEFKFSGYVDVYYARYSDSVGTNNYQKFPVISPKSNVFGLNIAQLSAIYNSKNIRGIFTVHFGDIPTSAWSPVYNMVQEANAGVRLGKKFWLDAGFFKTHIGTEALLPKDNIASSLSVITVYEPWFQSGIKLTYTPSDNYIFCLHILNGYNTFVDNNRSKSYGVSIVRTFGEKGSLGYYNLIGDEYPDGSKDSHIRFLNNLVFTYQLTSKLKALIGVDYISQQNSSITSSNSTASIYSSIVTLQYKIKPKFSVFGRYEMFNDPDGFLSGTTTGTKATAGYKLNGFTGGAEYKPTDNSYIRFEARGLVLDKSQMIFETGGVLTNVRTEWMLNLGVWF